MLEEAGAVLLIGEGPAVAVADVGPVVALLVLRALGSAAAHGDGPGAAHHGVPVLIANPLIDTVTRALAVGHQTE